MSSPELNVSKYSMNSTGTQGVGRRVWRRRESAWVTAAGTEHARTRTFRNVTRLQLVDLLKHEGRDGRVVGVRVVHHLKGLLKLPGADQVVVRVVEQPEELVHVHLRVLVFIRQRDRLQVLNAPQVRGRQA